MAGPYDLDHEVSVPGATLTTFRTQLLSAASGIGIVGDAFTTLSDVALPITNRYLATTRWVYRWAAARGSGGLNYTFLRDAAKAVLDQSTGVA